MPSTYLSTKQVAARLNVHENTVYALVKRDILKPIRFHKTARYRFTEEAVEAVEANLGLNGPAAA